MLIMIQKSGVRPYAEPTLRFARPAPQSLGPRRTHGGGGLAFIPVKSYTNRADPFHFLLIGPV
jgi:hypothetical protein